MTPTLDRVSQELTDMCEFYQVDESWIRGILINQRFPESYPDLVVKGTPNYTLTHYNDAFLAYLAGIVDTTGDVYLEDAAPNDMGLLCTPVVEVHELPEVMITNVLGTFQYDSLSHSLIKISGLDAIGFLGLLSPYFTRLRLAVLAILFGDEAFKLRPTWKLEHLTSAARCQKIKNLLKDDEYLESKSNQFPFPNYQYRIFLSSILYESYNPESLLFVFPDMTPRNVTYKEYIRSQIAQVRFGLDLTDGSYPDAIIGYLWGYENLIYAMGIYGDKYLDVVPTRVKAARTDISHKRP